MPKLLLFGGTFDPVHNGHILLLKEAINSVIPDIVIIMPTGIPPHKAFNDTDSDIKLKMCEAFLPLFDNILIDKTEIERQGKSYTVHTIEYLKNKYKNYEIYISMGSDMLLIFRQWKEYKAILKNAVLVVHCREHDDIIALNNFSKELEEEGAKIIMVDAKIVEISSTQIRNLVNENKSINALVPKKVQEIIKEYNLYKK